MTRPPDSPDEPHDDPSGQSDRTPPYAGPPPMRGAHAAPSDRPRPAPPQYGAAPPYTSQPQYGPPSQYGQQAQYGPPPQYGQPQYGNVQPYGPPAGAQGPRVGIGQRLGARTLRRPDARLTPSLAAAGAVLLAAGLAVLAIGYLAHGFGLEFSDDGARPSVHGEGRRWLGAGLFLALTAAGYAFIVTVRRGPLATAGVVAAVIGVPLTLLFATIDLQGTFTGDGPVNADVIFLVSILVYLASYFLVPGARGRAVFLALAASNLVTYVAVKSAGTSLARLGASVAGTSPGLRGPGGSDTSTVTALGLVFGLGYYAIAAALDRSRRPGAAVALVYAGFGATVLGLASGIESLGRVGTGIALVLVGAVLAAYGGWAARRFTTWAWTGAVVLGVGVLVSRIDLGRYVTLGLVLAVVGVATVGGAWVLQRALHEKPDADETSPALQPAAPAR